MPYLLRLYIIWLNIYATAFLEPLNLPFICTRLQKKLKETEDSLLALEEKHKKAIATIKEKEFLITNLQNSGKLLSVLWFLVIMFHKMNI